MELDRNFLMAIMAIVFLAIILLLSSRIIIKYRKGKGPKVKKGKEIPVLEAVPSTPDSDVIFNSLVQTKRTASNLKRRGIDTSEAEVLIRKAESDYDQGREEKAKFRIEEAKELLLISKREWDEKTGFDVLPSTPTGKAHMAFRETMDLTAMGDLKTREPDEEVPELSKTVEKKPENYLPSRFTISLAETAIENAGKLGADVGEAQQLLMEAKACFESEDYDKAFKCALDSKREAEMLLGVAVGEEEEGKKLVSKLATPTTETEELKICSICGERKVPYICIEIEGGEETTCKECYEKSSEKEIEAKAEPSPPSVPKEIKEEEEEQHYCPNCGAKVKSEDVFCGKCGKPVKEELKCVGCGAKVEAGDVFCRKCGTRLVT